MALVLLLVLPAMLWQSLSALFTVEAERRSYEAEYQEEVILACRFQPVRSDHNHNLTVTWHMVTSNTSLEVYHFNNGLERLDQRYQGRVRLLTKELNRGWVRLQMSKLRINDSGTYQCLVQMGAADYKSLKLSVKASYKNMTKTIEQTAEGGEVLLTCQSEGYPVSSLSWVDRNMQLLSSRTTSERTPDQLFRVTSHIRVNSSVKNNYMCAFPQGPSANFNIPDEIPRRHRGNHALLISLIVTGAALAVIIIIWHQRKGRSLL